MLFAQTRVTHRNETIDALGDLPLDQLAQLGVVDAGAVGSERRHEGGDGSVQLHLGVRGLEAGGSGRMRKWRGSNDHPTDFKIDRRARLQISFHAQEYSARDSGPLQMDVLDPCGSLHNEFNIVTFARENLDMSIIQNEAFNRGIMFEPLNLAVECWSPAKRNARDEQVERNTKRKRFPRQDSFPFNTRRADDHRVRPGELLAVAYATAERQRQ